MSESGISNKKAILLLTVVISVIVLIICAIRLSIYSLTSYSEAKANATLKNMVGESSIILTEDLETGRPVVTSLRSGNKNEKSNTPTSEDVLDKYKTLYKINSDMVGWINLEGTNIDYPVMQTSTEEEYYLHRNFYKENAQSGLPFMDYRCTVNTPGANTIIYGHNMKNGSMFADLIKYTSKKYYEEHKFIRFDTIYEESIYEIVAVFKIKVSDNDTSDFKFYNFIATDSEEEFQKYYDKIRSISLYDIEATAISTDCLLTLSTCDHSVDDGRFIVVARKVSQQ